LTRDEQTAEKRASQLSDVNEIPQWLSPHRRCRRHRPRYDDPSRRRVARARARARGRAGTVPEQELDGRSWLAAGSRDISINAM